MRKFLILICIIRCLTTGSAQTISMDDATAYLPEPVVNIHIGLSVQDFQTKRDTAKMERDITFGYLYTSFKENISGTAVKSVNYKFDTPQNNKNTERPLYELSIEFSDAAAAENFVTSKFTVMYRTTDVAEKEWLLSTDKDYWLMVRKNGSWVTIAAMMSGTEWGFD